MTAPKDLDPSSSPRAFYGSELRRLREAAGMSQEKLGEVVFCSGTYIGQMESAVRRPQEDLSERLDTVFDSDGLLARLCTLANKSPHAEYFEEAADLEAHATTICEFAPALVPGLLQIEPYARAIILAAQPTLPEAEVDKLVVARLERSRLLTNPTKPQLWIVLDESVLRRPVGGNEVMAAQLQHIIDLAEARRIIIQVLPYSVGAHSLLGNMLTIMAFDDAPPVAYVESIHTGQLLDDPAVLRKCRLSYDLLRANALSPKASLAMLRSTAEEYSR